LEGKGIYTILLAIVAVLTLAVAVLVIFLFTTFNSRVVTGTESTQPVSVATERPVPPDELKEYVMYTGEGSNASGLFNLKASPEHPEGYLMVTFSVKYDVGPKRKLEEDRTALVEATYASELKQAASLYFGNLTYEDASDIATRQKAADTLRDTFNEIVNAGVTEKQVIVYKVVFDKWLVQ
jgi:flagellar basal body-associated protein FliL